MSTTEGAELDPQQTDAQATATPEPLPPAGSPSQDPNILAGGEPAVTPGTPAAAPTPAGADYTPLAQAAREAGLPIPEGMDDQGALRYLAESYRNAQQAQQLAQYGQAVLPHWSQFQQWLGQQQQQPQTPQKAWYEPWWTPPEYNPAWERLVTKDPTTGRLTSEDPSVLGKYQAYQQYRTSQVEKFLSNPFQYFEAPIQHLARQVAEEVVQKNIGGYSDQVYATNFVSQNSNWLHQRDPQGNVLRDPTSGQPALTVEGRVFAGYVLEAQRSGIQDVRAQQNFAQRMLERDLALQSLRQSQAGTNGNQQKQEFLQRAAGANHRPGQSGSLQPGGASGVSSSQNPRQPLIDRLRSAMAEAGYTDQTIMAEVAP